MSWKYNVCDAVNITGKERCVTCDCCEGSILEDVKAEQMAIQRNLPVDNRAQAAKEIINISSTENSPASKISNWGRSVYVQTPPIDDSVKKNLEYGYSNDNEDNEIPTKEANNRISSVSDQNIQYIDAMLQGGGGGTWTRTEQGERSQQNFKQTNKNSNHSTSHDTRYTKAKNQEMVQVINQELVQLMLIVYHLYFLRLHHFLCMYLLLLQPR